MNKEELIDSIATTTRLKKQDVAIVLESLAQEIASSLARTSEASIPNIGKLTVSFRPARTGRNPRTGASVEIPAKRSVKFKTAKPIKDAIA